VGHESCARPPAPGVYIPYVVQVGSDRRSAVSHHVAGCTWRPCRCLALAANALHARSLAQVASVPCEAGSRGRGSAVQCPGVPPEPGGPQPWNP
jgi:hypothetical protein